MGDHQDPTPPQDATHLRLRPTDTQLSPDAVEQGFCRLHSIDADTGTGSWLSRLSGPAPPTIEFRLQRPPGTDADLMLYAGIEDAPVEPLREGLRTACPNEYELTPATPDPVDSLTESPAEATDPDADETIIGDDSAPTDETTDPDVGDSPSEETASADDDADPSAELAAVEWVGDAERRDDWQTRLTPLTAFQDADDTRPPLAVIAETLADTTAAVIYQVVCRRYRDWRGDARDRQRQLDEGRDTMGSRLVDDLVGDVLATNARERAATATPNRPDPATAGRQESIAAADPQHAFCVNARCVIAGPDARSLARRLATALETLSGDYYTIDGRIRTGEAVAPVTDAIRERTVHEPTYETARTTLPWTANRSRGLVMDAATAPAACLLDGPALTTGGDRAMDPAAADRTALPPPPASQLDRYQTPGLTLGQPLDQDGEPTSEPIAVPPALQPFHVAWFGKTGSGKSTSLLTGLLANHAATDGADILVTPKGDDMATAYCRAHYAEYNTLENVYYFDCGETLPALSVFDIRDQLTAGIDRTTAVEDLTDHYIEILEGIMGPERFHQAVRSPDIIRLLVKALFDPVHGSDAFAHRELQQAAARFHETGEPPPVVDDELQSMLYNVAANSQQTFDELLQGVHNRIEKIPLDDRLSQLFNHVPDADDPYFDLRDVIDENAVVIIDTGSLRDASQQALTRTVLSKLWTALQRRAQTTGSDDRPLVNLYLEEAAQLVTSGIVDELLAQGRSFGCSVTLATQFPGQLRVRNETAYVELLNNVSTIVTGSVPVDDALTKRLATAEHDPTAIGNRLRALSRGEWLVRLPAPFNTAPPYPFLIASAPLPPGHPEGDGFRPARETAVTARIETCRDRTRQTHGLDLTTTTATTGTGDNVPDTEAETEPEPTTAASPRIDSALPYTERLPDPVTYDDQRHALVCVACETRYDPSPDGLRAAIGCCHDPDSVDRDDCPICDLPLKLTYAERQQSPVSDAGLRFLQAVYSAHQGRYDPDLEYDITRDSMRRLREYVGIAADELDELREAGLISRDCRYPHTLYTVTPDGRDAIGVRHREGVAHGAGAGDLSESSLHVAMVEVGTQFLTAEYVENPDSPAVDVEQYFEVAEGRLDAAAVDETGGVVAALEAERINNDASRAIPEDYDKLAAQDPEAAIWIVKNREAAHDVIEALNTPPDGDPRVTKTYGKQTRPAAFTVDQPGLTDVYTFQSMRDTHLSDD
ncbi:type IV secretory system conjugative DNA transfer family protein [Halorubrum rutilum]|uniref:Type IV secretory system conjugative DNA transfer family protein n=1 Tax=Halorubrum rutilum TaxID=1364933 RepID=A0ABD6AJ49_9EURY|nr:hypothetical protein [Halorubrum rutilum]